MRSIEGLRVRDVTNGVSILRQDGTAYFYRKDEEQRVPDNDVTIAARQGSAKHEAGSRVAG